MDEFVNALRACLAADGSQRQAGERALDTLYTNQPDVYFSNLGKIVADQSIGQDVRQLVGLQIKTALTATKPTLLRSKQEKWLALPQDTRTGLKQQLMSTLEQENASVSRAAAQALASISVVELPRRQFGPVIPNLIRGIQNASASPVVRSAALTCLGYICDEAEASMLNEQEASQIVGIIVSVGLQKDQPVEVKRAAAVALYHALFFADNNFEKEEERKVVMSVLLQTLEDSDETVRKHAYEALVLTAKNFYHNIGKHMDDIFSISMRTVAQDPSQAVAVQALEFWATIAEIEEEIKDHTIEGPSGNYILSALKYLAEMIQFVLVKQEEDQDDFSENVAVMGGALLKVVARLCGNQISGMLSPFIESGFQNDDWRKREASALALGCLLEGPDAQQMAVVVEKTLPVLMQRLMRPQGSNAPSEPHVLVRDTSAWVIGLMVDVHWNSILRLAGVSSCTSVPGNEFWASLLETALQALHDEPRVAHNGAYILHNLANHVTNEADGRNMLSGQCSRFLPALIKAADRDDADEDNLRTGCFEAACAIIRYAPSSDYSVLEELFPFTLSGLEQAIAKLQASDQSIAHQRARLEGQQIFMCALLQTLTLTLGVDILKKEVSPSVTLGARAVEMLLRVCTLNQSAAQEEALMALGAIASSLETDFVPFVPAVHPLLIQFLDKSDEASLVAQTANVIAEIARGIGGRISEGAAYYMERFIRLLMDTDLDKSAKPPIFGAIGDIALGMGAPFSNYLQTVMQTLALFHSISLPDDDEDLKDYVLQMRKDLCDAYVSIILAFKDEEGKVAPEAQALVPFVPGIVQLLKGCYTDMQTHDDLREHELVQAVAGLLGDMADTLGRNVMEQNGVNVNLGWIQETLTWADNLEKQEWAEENGCSINDYNHATDDSGNPLITSAAYARDKLVGM